MPNGEIVTATHTALLSHWDLPLQARKSHIFTGSNKALLSIETLFNHGYESTFNDKYVRILNKRIGKVIMKGTHDPHINLYMWNSTQKKKILTESTIPDKYYSGIAYRCKSKSTLVDYHHASCWSPTQSGWVKPITQNFFTSWLGL